mmetsp:Transcript_24079/g.48735  ORF Transcript_24079/g.48735 Transcript_24079/m.48735 type:complete len:244 (+) Transcript_24079:841-1572(+)
MSPRVPAPVLLSLGLPLQSTSVTRRDRMCFSSWTTFSVSPRLVLRCPLFLDVSPLLSVTNPPSLLIWVRFRSGLPPPARVPSPLSRPSMCLLMILLIPLLLPHSLTWMLPLCCLALLLSLVSTLLLIPLIPPQECLRPVSLVMSIMRWPVPPRSSSRTTRVFRISLPFLVWMSSLRMTSSLWHVPVRSRSSCPSPSMWLRFSQELQASSSPLSRPSRASSRSSTVNTMTSRKVHSTWLATLMR